MAWSRFEAHLCKFRLHTDDGRLAGIVFDRMYPATCDPALVSVWLFILEIVVHRAPRSENLQGVVEDIGDAVVIEPVCSDTRCPHCEISYANPLVRAHHPMYGHPARGQGGRD